VELVDLGFILERQHQTLVRRRFELADPFDGKLWHGLILSLQIKVLCLLAHSVIPVKRGNFGARPFPPERRILTWLIQGRAEGCKSGKSNNLQLGGIN